MRAFAGAALDRCPPPAPCIPEPARPRRRRRPAALTADAWEDGFALAYAAHAQANRQRQQLRREAEARRRAAAAEAGQGPTPDQAAWGAMLRERLESRNAVVSHRLRLAPALVSEAHPILALFVTKTHRAARLRSGATKSESTGTDSKLLGLDSAYVETNADMRGVLRVDLDAAFDSIEHLAEAIRGCGAPLPNIVVGHGVTRPHLIWLLAGSVPFVGAARRGPAGLFNATLRALTAALLPIGADPGGLSNSRRMKNPLSPAWSRAVLAPVPYSLKADPDPNAPGFPALVPALNLDAAPALLRQAEDARRGLPPEPDHPDPFIAAQSNALFRYLSQAARQRAEWHRENGSQAELTAELAAEALRLVPAGRTAERAAARLAGSVAAWTFQHYRPAARTRCATLQERQQRQAAGQAAGAAAKREATLAALLAAARGLLAAGTPVTQRAVAAAAGRAERTARDRWPEVTAALQEPAVEVAIDKKGSVSRAAAPRPVHTIHGPRPGRRTCAAGGRGPAGGVCGRVAQLPRPRLPSPHAVPSPSWVLPPPPAPAPAPDAALRASPGGLAARLRPDAPGASPGPPARILEGLAGLPVLPALAARRRHRFALNGNNIYVK